MTISYEQMRKLADRFTRLSNAYHMGKFDAKEAMYLAAYQLACAACDRMNEANQAAGDIEGKATSGTDKEP